MLSEPFRAVYCGAIVSGFAGVVFVAQPPFIFHYIQEWTGITVATESDSDKAQPGSLDYTLAALVCVFGAIVASSVYAIIRKTGGMVHYQVLVFYYGIIGTFSSSLMLFLFQWPPVNPPDLLTWVLLVAIGLCGCLGHTTLNLGAQLVDASRTAVLRNADIAFVLLWQVVLLHQLPTLWSWIGLMLICISTLFGALTKAKPSATPDPTDEELQEIPSPSKSTPSSDTQQDTTPNPLP